MTWIVDASDPRLITGTPEERDEARRDYLRHQRIARIVNSPDKTEIPRSQLVFGPRWIEHEPTGDFYREFGGDAAYSDNAPVYYVTESGNAVLLERADPASRDELAQKRAAREARHAAQAAATKALNAERREATSR